MTSNITLTNRKLVCECSIDEVVRFNFSHHSVKITSKGTFYIF